MIHPPINSILTDLIDNQVINTQLPLKIQDLSPHVYLPIISVIKKQKDGSQKKINQSIRVVSSTKIIENPLQTILNILSEESRLTSEEDVFRDVFTRLSKCSDIAEEFKEEKIEKFIEYLRVYIGKILTRIIECQKSRFNASVEKVHKISLQYEQEIRKCKKEQQIKMKNALLSRQSQLGKKLHERNIRGIFNSQITQQMESNGGINLQFWIKGAKCHKNFVDVLESNYQRQQRRQFSHFVSQPCILNKKSEEIPYLCLKADSDNQEGEKQKKPTRKSNI